MTAGPDLYNPYDVRDVHDLFRAGFPASERALPFPGLQAPIAPEPAPPPHTLRVDFEPPMERSRWWFLADDARELVQVQENFTARNWRRLEPPPGELQGYPGFDALKAGFQEQVDLLARFNASRVRPMPAPVLCELLYDNLIALQKSEGSTFRLSEVLRPLRFEQPFPAAGLQLRWFERVDQGGNPEAPLDLEVVASQVHMPPTTEGGAPPAFLKLRFTGRAQVQTWEEVFAFFEHAHGRIRARLVDLTSDECRATWN